MVAGMRCAEEILTQMSDLTCMMEDDGDREIYDEPSAVDADEGNVRQKGPDAVDVRMTPAAAEETSERLLQGAMKARGQRYFEDADD
jgi:hypothetical protein